MGVPTASSMSVASMSSAASSVSVSSAAGSEGLFKKQHRKRGGGKNKKTGTLQWNASHGKCQGGSGCSYLHGVRPRDIKSEDEGGPSRRPRQTSRAGIQAAGFVVFGLAMVSQIEIAEAADVATTTAEGGCVLVAAPVLGGVTKVKRGTDAVGELVDEATAKVIEEFGKKCQKLVPTVFGVNVVPVLLFRPEDPCGILLEKESKTRDA